MLWQECLDRPNQAFFTEDTNYLDKKLTGTGEFGGGGGGNLWDIGHLEQIEKLFIFLTGICRIRDI